VRTERFAPRNSTPCALGIERMEMRTLSGWRCLGP